MNRWRGENNPHPKPTIFVVQTRSFWLFFFERKLVTLAWVFAINVCIYCTFLQSLTTDHLERPIRQNPSGPTGPWPLKFPKTNLLCPQVILETWHTHTHTRAGFFFLNTSSPVRRSAMRPSEEVLHWRTLRWNLAKKMGGNTICQKFREDVLKAASLKVAISFD